MTSLGTRIGLALVLIAGATSPPAVRAADPSAARSEQPGSARAVERSRELGRREIEIRRARGVTRRIMHDRRASPEMKQQASELDTLLDRREQILGELEARHKEFLDHHKAEIDELDDLRQRAHEVDSRLRSARNDALKASESDIATLKESSTHAADLAEALRATYFEQRRDRRRQ